MPLTETLKELLIIGLDPSLLERDVFWFETNSNSIKRALQEDGFWKNNAFLIKTQQKISPSELLRILDELGYERAYETKNPGQYSQKGSLVEIYPLNKTLPFKIDFFGNIIEQILPLKSPVNEKERSAFIKRRLTKEKNLLISSKPGDYLVHTDHGIGIYRGLVKVKEQQYLSIEYAPPRTGATPDRLLVPTRQIKKIAHYIGFTSPTLHRLGSALWENTKRKAKEDVLKLAKELLELYARRELTTRPAHTINEDVEKELISTFKFEETKDQLQAIEDIKKDLSQNKPMDRLVCGDVGFGKTEVALRAAALIVSENKQVAILAPTTILADQHFSTLSSRMKNVPVNIGLISRLEKKSHQKLISQKMKNGGVDIVIGTHRLLSKDVGFKNLGLLIIDEEQRFGVKQKEKLKQIKSSVDVLSLSATPIPRTLSMILSGLKSVSLIETPPINRKAIETKIEKFDKNVAKKAIELEISRHGQIYWLHNRIETISNVERFIQKLTPSLKIGTIHGRLPEKQLREIMHSFRNKKIDLLLATTIIENGLDLSSVNTLIVDDATRLGLGQAHQLRGRIGRTNIQAYAYFFHPEKMAPKAKERLDALRDYQYLGAGYQIAKKDLEIRGAGNLLGREQSGTINGVGLNLYYQMLAHTIEEISQGKITPPDL
ncbi:DEAD/DEAH box helicase [Candidatus Parcubacteria bacterium]|nr:MAG: DEAD/DEAH box helicase [Candidatus Parcubacteria bacterium]